MGQPEKRRAILRLADGRQSLAQRSKKEVAFLGCLEKMAGHAILLGARSRWQRKRFIVFEDGQVEYERQNRRICCLAKIESVARVGAKIMLAAIVVGDEKAKQPFFEKVLCLRAPSQSNASHWCEVLERAKALRSDVDVGSLGTAQQKLLLRLPVRDARGHWACMGQPL